MEVVRMDQPIEFVIRASQPGTVEALRKYAARRLSFLLRRFERHIRRSRAWKIEMASRS